MAELEKYLISKVENSLNLDVQWFYKLLSILQSAHVMPKNNNGNVFYVNNYIDWD